MKSVAVDWLFLPPTHALVPVSVSITPPAMSTGLVGYAVEMEQYASGGLYLTTQIIRGTPPPDPTEPPPPGPTGPYNDLFICSMTTAALTFNQDVELQWEIPLDEPLTVRYYCGGTHNPKGGSFFTILRFI